MLPPLELSIHRRHGASRLFRAIVLALIGFGLIVLAFMLTHKPEDERAQTAAEVFIVSVQSNDADKAYGMGNEAFRSATSEEGLKQLFDQIEPFVAKARIDKVDSYYATSSKGSPRAIFVYTATKEKRVTYVRIVMDKQSDAWLVHSLITKAQPLQAQPE
jgi:hypothetical protein